MRKVAVVLFVTLLALPAAAQQLRLPRPSPKATLTQTVGITDITINYSRPGVKGRQIWGGLVPLDKVWRTGANEATTIQFADEVLINGQKLAKGTYSFHTIPNPNEWTIIFNSVADQWGSYSYDEKKDALRVTARPEKAEFREWMTFEIPEMTTDTAKVVLRWENVAVPFTVDTQATKRVVASAQSAIDNAWRTPYQAANFAFDNNMPDLANKWLDESMKAKQTMANLWLKARMQQKAGNKAEAIKTGELALAKKTPQDNADFAAEIQKTIDGWKK